MRGLVMRSMVVAVLLVATPAWAGEKERAAALELVKLVVPADTYAKMIEQLVAAMSEQYRAQGEKLPADFATKIEAAVKEVIPYNEVLNWTVDIYAARFTVAELKEIGQFYQTPVGKKLMALLPELGAETSKKITTVLPERLPAALKKHGLLPDDDAAAPEPAPEAKPAPAKQKK